MSQTSVNRFDRCHTEAIYDGWVFDENIRKAIGTEIAKEYPRSFIIYNKSPDLPFDHSISPYRGCEHGCVYCHVHPSHAFKGFRQDWISKRV